MKLKATFPNSDRRLFSSQFVNARLLLDVQSHATVVPAAAIQPSPKGPFAYVVKSDHTVTAALAPGDQIVIDGADRPREGATVIAQARGGS